MKYKFLSLSYKFSHYLHSPGAYLPFPTTPPLVHHAAITQKWFFKQIQARTLPGLPALHVSRDTPKLCSDSAQASQTPHSSYHAWPPGFTHAPIPTPSNRLYQDSPRHPNFPDALSLSKISDNPAYTSLSDIHTVLHGLSLS